MRRRQWLLRGGVGFGERRTATSWGSGAQGVLSEAISRHAGAFGVWRANSLRSNNALKHTGHVTDEGILTRAPPAPTSATFCDCDAGHSRPPMRRVSRALSMRVHCIAGSDMNHTIHLSLTTTRSNSTGRVLLLQYTWYTRACRKARKISRPFGKKL